MAKRYESEGAEWLHVVDLDAALEGVPRNRDLVAEVIKSVGIPVQCSGGIRDTAAVDAAKDAGAGRVVVGTAALRDPSFVEDAVSAHGAFLAVGLDVRGRRCRRAAGPRRPGSSWPTLERLVATGVARVRRHRRDARRNARGTELLAPRLDPAGRTDPVVASGGVSSLATSLARVARRRRMHRRQSSVRRQVLRCRTRWPRWAAMLARRIIPCLDVDAGRVVKGITSSTSAMPAIPSRWPRSTTGGRRRTGVPRHHRVVGTPRHDLRRRSAHGRAGVHPAHGRRGSAWVDDVRNMLRAGADKVALNTAAVRDPDVLRASADEFGSQCIVIAIDARRAERLVGGRRRRRPHATGLDAIEWAGARRRARRRRDPADEHGSRRHEGRLRPRADPRGVGRRATFR